jgi:hypothetical protein
MQSAPDEHKIPNNNLDKLIRHEKKKQKGNLQHYEHDQITHLLQPGPHLDVKNHTDIFPTAKLVRV